MTRAAQEATREGNTAAPLRRPHLRAADCHPSRVLADAQAEHGFDLEGVARALQPPMRARVDVHNNNAAVPAADDCSPEQKQQAKSRGGGGESRRWLEGAARVVEIGGTNTRTGGRRAEC